MFEVRQRVRTYFLTDAKFLAALQRARRRGTLRYLGHSAALSEPGPWEHLIAQLWKEDWVVYCKPPFGGPAQVLKYLSRYTHRVAISNQRLLSVANGVVRFAYRAAADHGQRQEMALPAPEFLRRFLLHIVPPGFMRRRHYGLTANCRRTQKLARCRALLAPPAAPPVAESATAAAPADPAGPDDAATSQCPACGGLLRVIEILAPISGRYDTS